MDVYHDEYMINKKKDSDFIQWLRHNNEGAHKDRIKIIEEKGDPYLEGYAAGIEYATRIIMNRYEAIRKAKS